MKQFSCQPLSDIKSVTVLGCKDFQASEHTQVSGKHHKTVTDRAIAMRYKEGPQACFTLHHDSTTTEQQ